MGNAPLQWDMTKSTSFLTTWLNVHAFLPPGTAGFTQSLFMCIAFEESRYTNRIQQGWEGLAKRHDEQLALHGDTKKMSAADKKNLPNIAVGYAQVQIKQFDKAKIISDMGYDPKTLTFAEVIDGDDLSLEICLRHLAVRGLNGQVAGHPEASKFKQVWPENAKMLRTAIRDGNHIDLKFALSTSIINPKNRVPADAGGFWEFLFPEEEVDYLFSPPIQAMV